MMRVSPRTSSRAVLVAVACLLLGIVAAYHHTLRVPFVFDDEPSILDNPSIRSLGTAWSPPAGFGFTVSGRPLLNVTLALNYAISGTDVGGYHLTNVLIHALAACALFGLVRRTLLLPSMGPHSETRAVVFAAVAAAVWALHPLQTESVTYVIQRAESLMGLFFLLTLYGWARSAGSPRPRLWFAVAWLSCLLGVLCKEVMAVAPVVVVLYDRTFVAGSFQEVWRRHRWPHAALFATWLPLAWLVLGTGGDRGGTFALTFPAARDYWLAQAEAIATYLSLSVWPSPLIFDYGVMQDVRLTSVLLEGLVVLGFFIATSWALWRRPVAGFLGAAFFLILAPTSLLPGVTQTMVEHRMYLPLAAVWLALLGGINRLPALARVSGRWKTAAAVLVIAVFGLLTFQRNTVYQTKRTLWADTVAKRPQSAIAQANLGSVYFDEGNLPQARVHYEAAVRLNPHSAQAQYNLGLTLAGLGENTAALAHFEAAVAILPYFAQAQVQRAAMLIRLGRAPEAFEPLKHALSYIPDLAEGHYQLGLARLEAGQPDLALAALERAEALNVHSADIASHLGVALLQLGRLDEARRQLDRALQLQPGSGDAHYHLGLLEVQLGRADLAERHYADAVHLDPGLAEARLNLGIIFAQRGELAAARAQLEAAIAAKPRLAEAHNNLGLVLGEQNELPAAQRALAEAVRLQPDYAQAHYNLGYVLARLGRREEAVIHLAEALRLRPDFVSARTLIEQLQ